MPAQIMTFAYCRYAKYLAQEEPRKTATNGRFTLEYQRGSTHRAQRVTTLGAPALKVTGKRDKNVVTPVDVCHGEEQDGGSEGLHGFPAVFLRTALWCQPVLFFPTEAGPH
ncbi:hypothetical protein NDU88_001640 [Pleurodeles waltl]|uniref:Uncharacterized protein n=1 Tax=Pleurodeles waltl TaxID=8319 RepID=A0AAV7W0L5_PLEWA|nr:hypothetical protein NDU88_001640 [Pleurodeles waltl]